MPFDRRSLLKTTAAAAGLVAVGCETPAPDPGDKSPEKKENPEKAPPPQRGAVHPEVLLAMTAVAERVLPSEGEGPGAKEAAVGTYLGRTLADPRMRGVLGMLNRAAKFLNRAAQVEHKTPKFALLAAAQQDEIIGKLAERQMRPDGFDGPTFVRVMVALSLEGYLGDPAHGGNKDRVAWSWLGYEPGVGGRVRTFGGAR